jgi:hypothetical protein
LSLPSLTNLIQGPLAHHFVDARMLGLAAMVGKASAGFFS